MQALVRRLAPCWPPLAYLLLAVPMTWPLLPQLATSLPGTGDAQLQAWTIAWNIHALQTTPSQLWNAPIFYPYPDTLAYTDNHLLLSLLVAPLVLVTNNPLLAHNLLVLLSFALSGWAVYCLSRQLTDRAWPAFIAGAAFAFCAYRLAHVIQLNLLQTAWLPFALLFLIRLLRPTSAGGGRLHDALLCGLFAGIQCATALYYAFFAAAVLAGYSTLWLLEQGWHWLRKRQTPPWRSIAYLGLAGMLALLIALPFTIPYTRVYASLGIVRSPRELDNWSAPLRAYWSVESRNLLYGPLGERFVDNGEMVLFPGLLITLLGLAGLLLSLRTRHALFWALLISCAFVLSLGTGVRFERYGEPLPIPLPYNLLYSRLPGFGALRVPARWGLLVSLGLAVLAAFALARLFERLRGPLLHSAGLLLLALVLGEQAVRPLQTPDPARLLVPPPVYTWLAQPAQNDIRVVLELPLERVPRGPEIERITWRQWHGRNHWKALPVGYSGLFPFGTSDLLARVQNIADPATAQFLQLVGVDTLVIHGDEYDPPRFEELRAALAASTMFQQRAMVGNSLVYSLLPAPEQIQLTPGPGVPTTVCISADERMPGLPVLALARRWAEAGLEVYGPGRPRYYAPLQPLVAGQVCDYGLLSDSEDPLDHGYYAADRFWQGSGLNLYRRNAQLIASLKPGTPAPGEFHPRFPAELRIEREAERITINGTAVTLEPGHEPLIELDVLALGTTTLRLAQQANQEYQLEPGLNRLSIAPEMGSSLWQSEPAEATAIYRIRVLHGPDGSPGIDRLPVASATSTLEGTVLTITARAAGTSAVLLDIRGAAAYDDRPIKLVIGALVLPEAGAELQFAIDLFNPIAPWLTTREPAQDGRYIAYLKDAERPDGPGRAIAQFTISGGRIANFAPVPLPLNTLP
jgi:hypothetical protein